MKTKQKKLPPKNARRIWRVADLPPRRGVAWYSVETNNGTEQAHLLSKRRRQIMDLLMCGPVYCASPVRISDVVHILKRETGIEVETEYYPGDEKTGSGTYGVYFLKSKVRRVVQGVAA